MASKEIPQKPSALGLAPGIPALPSDLSVDPHMQPGPNMPQQGAFNFGFQPVPSQGMPNPMLPPYPPVLLPGAGNVWQPLPPPQQQPGSHQQQQQQQPVSLYPGTPANCCNCAANAACAVHA